MPITVEVPEVGDVEFPDGMTDDEISSAILSNFPNLGKPTPSLRADIPMPGRMERAPATPPNALERAQQPVPAELAAKEAARDPKQAADSTVREYEQLKGRYGMALELTQDPAKRERLTQEFKRDAKRLGVDVMEDVSLGTAAFTPLKQFQGDPETIKAAFPGRTGEVLAGINEASASALSAFTSPVGIATLGQGAFLSKSAQQAVSGAFAADMARHIPEQIGETVAAIKEGDTQGAVRAGTGALMTSVFAAGAAKHALGKPKGELVGDALKEFEQTAKRSEVDADAVAVDALSPVTLAAARAEQVGLPATAAALKDLTGQPEVTTKSSQVSNELVVDPEAKPKGEIPNAKEEGRTEGVLSAPLETSVAEATRPLNELMAENTQRLGITPGAKATGLPSLRVPEELLKSESKDVEARWQSAHGVGERSVLQKVKSGIVELKDNFTRHYPKLDPAQDGRAIDTLRQFEATPVWAKEMAGQAIRGFTAGFKPEHMNLFERVVILRDLARDVESGKYDGKDIPFGYANPDMLKADLTKFETIAQENPGVADALKRRNELLTSVRDKMVEEGLLPEAVKERPDYFHRQVMEYMRLREEATTGTASRDVRTHTKGFQRERTNSSKDYNTSYLEAEYEVLSQAYAQINTVETLKKLKQFSDIRPQLEEIAKESNNLGNPEGTWREFIPKDYTVWQPKRGNLMYRAQTLSDKIIEQVLNGEKLLEEGDLREVLAVGGKRQEWVIPKRLAETLDDYKARPDDNPLAKASAATIYGWKKFTLFSPTRVIRYELNNFSGDLDIALAWRPEMLKYAKKAAIDSWDYRVNKKAPSAEQLELIRKGVLGSGFFTEEVGGISRNQLLDTLVKPNRNVVSKYFRTVEAYNAFREDVMRLAAYRYAKERLEAGEKIYGASNKAELDAIPDIADKAAKISRELIGDYGNVSRAGQWMRKHMIPFYSWMEINAPRYVRLARNIKNENAGLDGAKRLTGAVAGKAALGAAKFTAKAAGLYALVNLWNQSMFPEENKEVNRDRNQMHLILGRRDDGSIMSLRFQGAFSDALSWFDAQDYPQDIADAASGDKSVAQLFMEATVAPINKVVNASHPIGKTIYESVTGTTGFPEPLDVRNIKGSPEVKSGSRAIRDPVEHMARLFTVDMLYRWAARIPTPGVKADLAKLMVYTTNPGESAYAAARQIIAEYKDREGIDKGKIGYTEKGNAVYYHKQAIKYGDKKLAERWKQRYFELGGTQKGLNESIQRAQPLEGLNKRQRADFFNQLSPEDAAIVAKAEKWYRETYQPKPEE